MRTAMSFALGALAASLIAAAAFRGGGQPLDSTFTYQGQLRNAGQLVNGTADLRFTLWDSDVGGMQVGTANTFNAYPLTDGRFALGLNFGAGAFNGDQRWVQIEFRNPAGVGQYLTLSPRDKINATPYALYALNGAESQWSYNPKTQALSAAQNVAKVGIGTNAPTAALEVVAEGGDDAVKLPAGSIGAGEVDLPFPAGTEFPYAWQPGQPADFSWTFTTEVAGFLLVQGVGNGPNAVPGNVRIDDQVLGNAQSQASNQDQTPWSFLRFVPVTAGSHSFRFTVYPPLGTGYSIGPSSGRFVLMFVRSQIATGG